MTFELVPSSHNKRVSTVKLDGRNSSANVWWCDGKQEWHWCLVWEDGGPMGTHMHNGTAPSEAKARADIAQTILWIEDTFPTEAYWCGV